MALSTALDPSTIHSIDVAAVNGQPFMNTAVAGSLAETSAEELDGKWKRLLGPVAIGFHGGCGVGLFPSVYLLCYGPRHTVICSYLAI